MSIGKHCWPNIYFFSGVFYHGFVFVLPTLYKNSSPTVIWLHEYLCYFMLFEMLINWACVKLLKSPFRPEDHTQSFGTDEDQLLATGFEINLNNLKRTKEDTVETAGVYYLVKNWAFG